MVYNLVAKHGIVRQGLYPDSFSAGASSTLNSILFTKLREYALVLQHLFSSSSSSSASSLSETKAKMLREIHTILTLTLGPSQSAEEPFTWEFTDKSGRARTARRGMPVFLRLRRRPGQPSDSRAAPHGPPPVDWEAALNVSLLLLPPARLRTGESLMTHIMVLTGVHVDEETEPVVLPRWDPMGSLA
ncbi:hypothetical protein MYCTH_2297668 [Thermothelomyces thermophilus ATCC 42464]|uniref:Uncharacterized protein n=1 Tax=Thermothelomyces thermophilus (strain ATCC 42464 / BCRC 31852 / DSM 1799) TaxID=573729 RepID=G2Q6H0_THET4|nr:uncharacterized protein MYCTH_2297668 [Thermothelomyces thermophilus ATCC 42464]AEO54742.1 hypothetical protein MYCTH_2297668 [Thermothelomyces thermophilus ATCC 42464]